MPLVGKTNLCLAHSGKNLTDDCLAVNFAVGCTHGCPFCYVQRIDKLWGRAAGKWGEYLSVKPGLERLIAETPWQRYTGREVLMSSTHDPYLPELYFPRRWPRRILEAGLEAGVRFRILTRSVLVRQDFDLLVRHREQAYLMMSVPTLDEEFTRLTEPRAPLPKLRLKTLFEARALGLKVGVVVAPIIPVDGWRQRLEELFAALSELGPYAIYGEMLHARGENLERLCREAGICVKPTRRLDEEVGRHFERLLLEYGLRGAYWYEYSRQYGRRAQ